MTTPVPADPAFDAPTLLTAGLKELVSEADSMGISWKMTLGTVVDYTTLQVLCDGDTANVTVVTCIGDLFNGQRVYILQVPPSGNFVIGSIPLISPGRGIAGVGAANTVGLTANSSGLEVAMPTAAWVKEPVVTVGPNRICKVTLQISLFLSSATDTLTVIRLRKGAATIVGTQLWVWFTDIASIANTNPATKTLVGYLTNTTSNTVVSALTISNQRSGGAANLSIFAGTIPMSLLAEDIGAVTDWPDLAAMAGSL